jgi:hypothetical protein
MACHPRSAQRWPAGRGCFRRAAEHLALIVGLTNGCSDPGDIPPIGSQQSKIVNGETLTNNEIGLLTLSVDFVSPDPRGPSGCSAGVIDAGGRQVVATAAHCFEPHTPDKDRVPASAKLALWYGDPFATDPKERRESDKFLIHPAYVGHPPGATKNARVNHRGTGVDLAMIFLDTPFAQLTAAPLSIAATPPAGLLQTQVEIAGWGDVSDTSDNLGDYLTTTIAELDLAVQAGRAGWVGTLLRARHGQHPVSGLIQATEGGDSGGMWVSELDGVKQLVAVHNASSRTHGQDYRSVGAALDEDRVWFEFGAEVAAKGGTVVEAMFDYGSLMDQLLVSNRQGQDSILIMTGEGRRFQTFSPRPHGFGSGELRSIGIGQLDGSTPRTGPRDLVGIADGNLIAIFDPLARNPLVNPLTVAFSSPPGEAYEAVRLKRCNADDWDDVLAFKPRRPGDILPRVDVYFGSEAGLVGPNSDRNSAQCVFVSPNPLLSGSLSLQGSCRAGSSVLATTCGARLGENGCWCTADCGDPAHPCCDDVSEVCGDAGGGMRVDHAVAAILEQEAEPWIDASFFQVQPLFSVAFPAESNLPRAFATPLNSEWLLTWTEAVHPEQLLFGQDPIADYSTLKHPDANLALIHLPPGSAPGAVAAGLELVNVAFFSGTPDVLKDPELGQEDDSRSFVVIAESDDGHPVPVAVPVNALIVNPQMPAPGARRIELGEEPPAVDADLFGTEPASLALLQTLLPEAVADGPRFHLRLGAPMFTPLGQLVGVTERTDTGILGVRDLQGGASADREVSYLVHRQAPFYQPNATASDVAPSPRYWLNQAMARSKARDLTGDHRQDLLIGELDLDESGGQIGVGARALGLRGPLALASSPQDFGIADTLGAGNWELVGRAKLGLSATAIVWSERDTGEMAIWRMNGGQVDARFIGAVPPTWKIAAIGDIDGDDISDLIWTNSVTGRGFYWMMHALDGFTIDEIEGAPDASLLVREFNHFPTQIILDTDGEVAFELVAAEHFHNPPAETGVNPTLGPEQAAVDLLWAEVEGDAWTVWPMTYLYRPCVEIYDVIMRDRCESLGVGYMRSYELARRQRSVQPTSLVGTGFYPVALGDFDEDGRVDIVARHQTGAAPTGELVVAFGLADGTFGSAPITTADGAPVSLDPRTYQIR